MPFSFFFFFFASFVFLVHSIFPFCFYKFNLLLLYIYFVFLFYRNNCLQGFFSLPMKSLAIIFISSVATFFWWEVGLKNLFYFASHYLGFAFFIFLLMKYHAGSILLLASGGDEFFWAQLFPSSGLRDKPVPTSMAYLWAFLFSPTFFAFQNRVSVGKVYNADASLVLLRHRRGFRFVQGVFVTVGKCMLLALSEMCSSGPLFRFLPRPHWISVALGSLSACCCWGV